MIKRYRVVSPAGAQLLEREDGEWVRFADLTDLSVLDDSIREALRSVGLDYQVGAITSRVGEKLKELFGTELKPSHAETLWTQIQELCTEFGCPAGMTTRGWIKHRLNVLKQWEEGDTDGEWKTAVLEQCHVAFSNVDEDDAHATVRELMRVNSQIALDPRVSEQARDLVESGRAEAKANSTKVFYDDKWMTVSEVVDALKTINDFAQENGFEGVFAAVRSAATYKEGLENLNVTAQQLGFQTVAFALAALEDVTEETEPESVGPELVVGQEWFVQLPGSQTVSHMILRDVTVNTVVLGSQRFRSTEARYKKSDVEFVELA